MKKILLPAALAAILLTAAPAAKAADQDLEPLTCRDIVQSSPEELGAMAMWIDGYITALTGNFKITEEWQEKLGTHIGNWCAQNPDKKLKDLLESMPPKK